MRDERGYTLVELMVGMMVSLVVLGAIMSILDIKVVNVALPTFQTVFGSPGDPIAYSTVAWSVRPCAVLRSCTACA